MHGQDIVILAVNPERFAITGVYFDLSAQVSAHYVITAQYVHYTTQPNQIDRYVDRC